MSYVGLYGVMLATAVTLVAYAGAVLEDNDFAMTLSGPKVSQRATSGPLPLDSKRHLRDRNETMADDDNFEDRILEGASTKLKSILDRAMQNIKMFADVAEPKVLVDAVEPKMASAQQQIDEHFKQLMPEGVDTLNFGTEHFQKWDDIVTREHPEDADVAMITTLMNYVDDVHLTQKLMEARKVQETKAIATRLMKAQLTYWLAMKKRTGNVFTLLKLHEKTDLLLTDMFLTDPMVKVWISYVGKVDKKRQARLVLDVLKEYIKEDDALVRMILEAEKVEETKALAAELIQEQINRWLSEKKDSMKVFTLLKLDAKTRMLMTDEFLADKLLADPMVKVWISYVGKHNDLYQAWVVWTTFRPYVRGEDAFVRIILEAEKVEETKALAAELIQEQIKRWLSNKMESTEVFTLLKLDEKMKKLATDVHSMDVLLADPMVKVWISYVEKVDKKRQGELVLDVLKKYVKEDDALVRMILEAEKVEETEALAAELIQEQIKRWLSKKKDSMKVFTLLKLDKKMKKLMTEKHSTDMLLADPMVKVWISYVGKVDKKRQARLVLDVLKKYVKEDDALVRMILEAEKVEETEALAAELIQEQINRWLSKKKDSMKVFTLLELDGKMKKLATDMHSTNMLLADPMVKVWISYVEKVDKKRQARLVLDVLKKYVKGDDALVRMILEAEKVEETEALAAELIQEQIKRWLSNKMESTEVFTLLKLDEKMKKLATDMLTTDVPLADVLLTDPMMKVWISYVGKVDKKRQGELVLDVLKKYVKEDDALVRMILEAEKFEETEALAAELIQEQIKRWISDSKKTPMEVFTLLELDGKMKKLATDVHSMDILSTDMFTTDMLLADVLLADPMMMVWISYVGKVDKKRQAELVLDVLKKYVKGDDALVRMIFEAEKFEETKALAAELIQEQIKRWIETKKTAGKVFLRLKLHKRADILLTDPVMKVWMSFVNKAYNDNPIEILWTTLKAKRDKGVLVKMLVDSEKIEESKDLATELLKRQFSEWSTKGEYADNVFLLLQLHHKTDMFLVDPLVKRWMLHVGNLNKEKQVEIIWDILKFHFKKEDIIAKIIFEGKKDHLARDIAQKLEDIQLSNWKTSKTSADKVYEFVKVGSEKGNPFEQPGFNIWASYVMLAEPEKSYEILMTGLKARYNDDRAVAELLAVEKTRDGLFSIEHLQKLQYQDWLDQQKTADDIFTLLKLHKRGNKIFEDKLWHTWVSYLAKLAEQTGERQEALMYSVLKEYNNEKDMMKLIQTARKNRDTEPIAATLLSEKRQNKKSGLKDRILPNLP